MNKYPDQRSVNILLVEDNADDVRQIRQVLQQIKIRNRLHVVGDGIEAMAYLLRDGPYTSAPSPNLVLLNVSLPQKSGIDVLTELKTNPAFAEVPVIMLTDPESQRGLKENCAFAVDGSIQKPISRPQLVNALMMIDTLSFLLVQSVQAF